MAIRMETQHSSARITLIFALSLGVMVSPGIAVAGGEAHQKHDTLFQQADANADGKLNREEFDAMTKDSANAVAEDARPAVQDATTLGTFEEKDANGDGSVSKQELYGDDLRKD